jgi:hypothetical protein
MIPYTFPVVTLLISANLALSLWDHQGPKRYIIAIVIAGLIFITAGFSETYATLQVTALLLILGALWRYGPVQSRREWLVIVFAFLLVATIGLILLAVSPGSHIRREVLETSLTIPDLILRVIVFTILVSVFLGYSTANLVFLAITVIVGLFWLYAPPKRDLMKSLPYPQRPWLFAIIVGVAALIMVAAVVAPMIYGSGMVVSRGLYAARIVQIGLFLLWGYLAAVGLARADFPGALEKRPVYRLVRATVMLLMIFMPLQALIVNANLAESLRRYASEWDARDEIILAAQARGDTRMDVPPFSYDFEEYLILERIESEEETTWVNSCASHYYDLLVFVDSE